MKNYSEMQGCVGCQTKIIAQNQGPGGGGGGHCHWRLYQMRENRPQKRTLNEDLKGWFSSGTEFEIVF